MLSTRKRAFTLLKSVPYDRQLRLLGFSNGGASTSDLCRNCGLWLDY
ncbi:Protein of unknown function [Lactobacillus equicursoris DSM 19284 = JCM 14600 = CIP 110162]|nr:Protein of unknown function [Lactobacillus equicursoris DSM 19284 = JCM 14600 = CIP 110162]